MALSVSSVDDLRSSLKCSIKYDSEKDFADAIEQEKAGQNRKTIIQLLTRGLKAKKLGKTSI